MARPLIADGGPCASAPCSQGPILLSLLSVFYTLHSEFMGSGGSMPSSVPMHRLWSPAAGTAAHSAAGHKGQGAAQQGQRHVRLATGEPCGGAGSPGLPPTELRISVPSKHAALAPQGCAPASAAGPAPGGGTPLHHQQSEQQQEQSVSLSLGRRPSLGSPQASPSLLAAMTAAARAQASDADSGVPGLTPVGLEDLEEEEDEEEGAADSQSQSFSASIGDSFSFNALRAFKLHDD